MVEKYGLQSFGVRVLSKERTLCEKIMSLVRFSFTPTPLEDLANKVRHAYDVHMMLRDASIRYFFDSEAFEEMLVKVGRDDVASYKNSNQWLYRHPSQAMLFAQPEATWKRIRTAYLTTFKGLVFGSFPREEEILGAIKLVAARLESMPRPLEKNT